MNKQDIANRFIRYAKIDTQADPYSETAPSTEKQKNLSQLLYTELLAAGITKVVNNQYGYVYATIPSNSTKKVPRIFFCAHVDTAPDCSGTDVKPILHTNYQGNDISLPDDESIVISPNEFEALKNKQGEDIITASGLTLLGADDKAGVTAIMEAALYLMEHPEIKHGDVNIFFTTDEEIGRGVNFVDPDILNSDFGYTLDGGELGCLESETFSADGMSLEITGVSTHPGYAKDKMESAIKIASEIVAALPKNRLCPEATSDRQGFVHPTKIEGNLEHAKIDFIIRDFDTTQLAAHESELQQIAETVLRAYPNSKMQVKVSEQYRNMKVILDQHPHVVSVAAQAIVDCGIPLKTGLIRGGTDGSRLSFMNLPCPNLFAGEHGIHSKKEWVSVQDMEKAAKVIVRICTAFEER